MNGPDTIRRLRRPRRVVACLATAAALTLAAACGSSAGSGSSPTTGAAATGPRPTGTPYVIGQVGSFSGAYASSSTGAKAALDAWARYTNDHGGINGHPVQLIQKDDQMNAALALSEVKELVEQDHIMALVGSVTIVEQPWTSYMASGTVPVIGDDLAVDTMGTEKNFFPEGTTRPTGYFYAMPKVAALQGKTKYAAIYCAETTACSQIATSQQQQAAAAGVSFVYSGAAQATAPSYASQCLAAKQAGADAVALLVASQTAGRIAAACAQQGFHPLWLQNANGFSEEETSTPALDGVVGPQPDFPWFASDNPAMQEFQSAMHTYEPDVFSSGGSAGYSGSSAQAWASAEIFRAAAQNLPAGQDSGQALTTQLSNLPKNDTFGGLTPPISFGDPGAPQPPVTCFFTIQLKSGKYTTLNGDTPVCQS